MFISKRPVRSLCRHEKVGGCVRAFWALYKREVLRFLRQRSRVVGALATPLVFWFLVGGGLGKSFQAPGTSGAGYFEFFFPGVLALSVLFTAIFSTMSVIEDRNEGFLQGVLVAPTSRLNVWAAKVVGGATLGLIQGLVLLAVATMSGVQWNFSAFVPVVILLFSMGAALTSLGFLFAWKLNSMQGYHGIMNIVLMPMWILSGAVFPAQEGSLFFKLAAAVNPLSYGMRALRDVLEVGGAGAVASELGSGYSSGMSSNGWSFFFFQGNFVMFLMLVGCAVISLKMMSPSHKPT